jgi:hypothetical protein
MYRKLKSTELQENELKTPNATQSSMIPLKLYTNATLSIPKAVEITKSGLLSIWKLAMAKLPQAPRKPAA